MNNSEQLTELRDALRGIRSELSLKALKDYISVFLSDSELKSILIADDVVRALWYCLWNNNADRERLIDKLYNFFTATREGENSRNRQPEEVRELISMILFLGGVDFQMNEIEIDEKAYQNETMAMPNQSQQTESLPAPKRKVRKRSIWLICAIGVIFVALIAALWLRSYHKNQEVVSDGKPLGSVVSTKGTNIMLMEYQQNGTYSLKAVSKKRNGRFVEEKVFRTTDGIQSAITSKRFKKWISSNPGKGFFVFSENDSSLYIPLINDDLTGADRYILYHFDGKDFVCTNTNTAGYWLHPTLQSFDRLIAMGRTISVESSTKSYLVRVDQMSDGSCRYAAWDGESNLNDKPSIILFNDGLLNNNQMVFYNGNYKYVVDFDKNNLWVFNGDKVIYCRNIEFLVKITNLAEQK